MISFDTNLLLYSLNKDCAEYNHVRSFFSALPAAPNAVAICELVLIELYVLLRNPAVLKNPLNSADAASLIQTFRQHPAWRLIDYSRRRLSRDERSLALRCSTGHRTARRL